MSIMSPVAMHPAEWTVHQVVRWLQVLQPPAIAQNYASKFREQGIEGDVLLQLDADTLREIGIDSVGHRLVLLRAIYELKKRWGVEMDADAWRPEISQELRGSERWNLPPTLATVSSFDMMRALQERDERLWALEREFARLVDWIRQSTDENVAGPSSFKAIEPLKAYLPPSRPHSSLPFAGVPKEDLRPLTSGASNTQEPGEVDEQSMAKPKVHSHTAAFRSNSGEPPNMISPTFHHPSQSSLSPTSSTPSATPTTAQPQMPSDLHRGSSSVSALAQANGALLAGAAAGNAGLAGPSSQTSVTASPTDESKKQGDGTSHPSKGDNSYKSFRVTLDDPCYKVLPAALKKYKINDDWRQYALFICYGTTERCLSYDEKPLLLFQKLKENKQSPVFMLRHIRDVKSPIAIATAKAAARKTSQEETSPTAARISGKVADAVSKFGGGAIKDNTQDPTHDKGASRPDAPFIDSPPGRPRVTGPALQVPSEKRSDTQAETYAIAIYPYVSEREDEFDVSVGDTFIVISKVKGWWVVQRDARASGHATVEGVVRNIDGTPKNGGEIKSGWVPAGCLLETRQPLSSIVHVPADGSIHGARSPTSPTTPTKASLSQSEDTSLAEYMASVPIPPTLISSTSTEGILLMSYDNPDENIHLEKDQRLRVFKRYNHWSYCVEIGGKNIRAWLPSWYIGRVRESHRNGHASANKDDNTKTSTAGMPLRV